MGVLCADLKSHVGDQEARAQVNAVTPLEPQFKRHFEISKQVLIYEQVFLCVLRIFTVAAKCLISLKKLVRILDPGLVRA